MSALQLNRVPRQNSRSAIQRRREMPFGPQVRDDGVNFRLWAPKLDRVDLKVVDGDRTLPMHAASDGWYEVTTSEVAPGSRYCFVLPDGLEVPDPASRHQPGDVKGPSQLIDPAGYLWFDADWRGRPWEELVIYELHVGTFTSEGTFLGVIEKLEHLCDLGVTAIELMPVVDFPGAWNWGYDGALLFAPDSSYGHPDDLKALVDAAHQHGIAVILDVVYNHFGPEGNYLSAYAPLFTERHHTPWGAAVNYDDAGSEVVRSLVVENALYWLREYNVDGLRLDAVLRSSMTARGTSSRRLQRLAMTQPAIVTCT